MRKKLSKSVKSQAGSVIIEYIMSSVMLSLTIALVIYSLSSTGLRGDSQQANGSQVSSHSSNLQVNQQTPSRMGGQNEQSGQALQDSSPATTITSGLLNRQQSQIHKIYQP